MNTQRTKHCMNLNRQRNKGFTLIEVTFSIIIVGVAIVSLMMLFSAGTQVNQFGNKLSTSVYLAEQIRAMTDQVFFDDLSGFKNQTYNGVDSEGDQIAGLNGYQQVINVEYINESTWAVDPTESSTIIRITTTILNNNDQLASLCWLRVKSN